MATYLLRSVVWPVSRVARAADQLSSGDLSQRVEERGPQEVAQLARSFNPMAGALTVHREQVETARGEAERAKSEYLTKPLEVDRFLRLIDRTLAAPAPAAL